MVFFFPSGWFHFMSVVRIRRKIFLKKKDENEEEVYTLNTMMPCNGPSSSLLKKRPHFHFVSSAGGHSRAKVPFVPSSSTPPPDRGKIDFSYLLLILFLRFLFALRNIKVLLPRYIFEALLGCVAIELSAGDFLPTQKTSILFFLFFFFFFSLDHFLRRLCCSEFACSISFVIRIESRACRWPPRTRKRKILQQFLRAVNVNAIYLMYIFWGRPSL